MEEEIACPSKNKYVRPLFNIEFKFNNFFLFFFSFPKLVRPPVIEYTEFFSL